MKSYSTKKQVIDFDVDVFFSLSFKTGAKKIVTFLIFGKDKGHTMQVFKFVLTSTGRLSSYKNPGRF